MKPKIKYIKVCYGFSEYYTYDPGHKYKFGVLGTIDEITGIIKGVEINEIIIAVPSASGDKMRRFKQMAD